jgi:hypothetical protein
VDLREALGGVRSLLILQMGHDIEGDAGPIVTSPCPVAHIHGVRLATGDVATRQSATTAATRTGTMARMITRRGVIDDERFPAAVPVLVTVSRHHAFGASTSSRSSAATDGAPQSAPPPSARRRSFCSAPARFSAPPAAASRPCSRIHFVELSSLPTADTAPAARFAPVAGLRSRAGFRSVRRSVAQVHHGGGF